jgi:tetratricopeptide (TPR) repeat protein
MMILSTRKILYLFVVSILMHTIPAQDARLDQAEKKLILKKMGTYLAENYILADIGEKYQDFLNQQLAKGAYNTITHPRKFAEQLTKDLQLIYKDEHIRVIPVWPDQQALQEQDPLLSFFLNAGQERFANFGFQEVKIYPGNIGYLNITSFEAPEQAGPTADHAMQLLQYTDALIIDLRTNTGGSVQMVQYLCSYFFDQPTRLNNYYWRRGDYQEEFWSLDSVNGKQRPDVPLIILIGPETFSAGEEFAYNLQAQKRALLIGEKTGGGAHAGRRFPLNERFQIFIPTGRAINPVTGSSWENVGVLPDLTVNNIQALSTALDKARASARVYRENRDKQELDLYLLLSANLKRADTLLTTEQSDSARQVLYPMLQTALASDAINEWSVNNLGYHFLAQKKYQMAILLFQFNTLHFPGSANVFDSLGEAYMHAHNRQKAVENYQKSLQLNPNNQNARYMLEKLIDQKSIPP